MKSICVVFTALLSLVDVCAGGNAVSAKAGMSTAEAIAAYEGTAEAARDPTEKEVEAPKDIKMKGSFKVYNAMPESLAADVVPDLTFTQHYGF